MSRSFVRPCSVSARSLGVLGISAALLSIGVAGSVGLVGCGAPPADLTVQSYTSDPTGFALSNHLIAGEREAILVDASFFRADAEKLVALVKGSGKALKLIWLTHAHPDHYLGLDVVLAAFPGTPVYSSPEVVTSFNTLAPGAFQGTKATYGAMIADKLATVAAYTEDRLLLEGEELRIVKLPEGESQVATALYAPRQRLLFSGDAVGNNAYAWTAECKLDQMLSNISLLKGVGAVDKLYPGHGRSPGSAASFDGDQKYLQDVGPILKAAPSANEAVTQIQAKHPSLDAAGILTYSTQLYYMNCRK